MCVANVLSLEPTAGDSDIVRGAHLCEPVSGVVGAIFGDSTIRWPSRTTVSSLIICKAMRDARMRSRDSRMLTAILGCHARMRSAMVGCETRCYIAS